MFEHAQMNEELNFKVGLEIGFTLTWRKSPNVFDNYNTISIWNHFIRI